MEKELIKLKGTIDGVKIYLDRDSPITDITNSLYEKLRQFRNFFGDGHCNIYFVGRELTSTDKVRLESVSKTMLPESTVNYGERKKMRGEDDFEKTLKLPNELKNDENIQSDDSKELDDKPFEEIKEVVTTNFKSSRARFYEGVVRSGKTVESDGHLVLVGNVEEGGKIVAVGNVIVMGSVKGKIEAGCMGNDRAYIVALDFQPSEVRIAKVRRKFDKSEFSNESKATKVFIADEQIFTDDFEN